MRKQFALLLPLLLLAVPALAETFPLDMELGYRWTSIDGNEDVYRSQINEEEGFLLRNFNYYGTDTSGEAKLVDTFRITASDLGSGPSSMLRIDAGRAEIYKFRFNYQRMEAYNALPAFANPLLGQGIIPGQHTMDRTRNLFDAEVEFLPGKPISFQLGYAQNNYEGPGTSTYFVGQDEFRVAEDVDDSEQEMRAGLSLNYARLWGNITQGWRSYSGDNTLTLLPGAGAGNNGGTILGQPVTASGIALTGKTEGDTPFTNLYLSGRPIDRLTLTGSYVMSSAESDFEGSETTTGSFVGFDIGRFFGGLNQGASTNVENDMWRGRLRAEFVLAEGIDLIAGYQTESRDQDGAALIETLFTNTVSFGGVNFGDLQQIVSSANAIERDEDVADIGVQLSRLGPFSVRATYSQTNQDITATPDVSEIVIDEPYGGQGGNFERTIDTFDLGASFVMAGFTLSAQYRDDSADDAVFRTDYLDRTRSRVRAAYATKGGMFRASGLVENTDAENLENGVGYDGSMDVYAANFELAPVKMLRLWASYAQHDAASVVSMRIPQSLTMTVSDEVEEGESTEAGFSLMFKPVSFDLAYGTFENEGSLPLEMNRLSGRVKLNLRNGAGIAAEYAYDEYDETTTNLSDYTAARYGIYLTLTR
ncbi:MAG: hypothetical protein WC538_16505 [Thermoanaerobaculia bacterium]|jgi:hypothetical protein